MTDKLWKQVERRVAELLGGKRVPITGREGSDIKHPWLAIEVKQRKAKIPAYIRKWINQAVVGAAVDRIHNSQDALHGHRLPIVVWHEKDTRHADDIVMMRMSDFIAWFGDSNGE